MFCGSDQIARGLAEALQEAGRDIPGDVALVGFDNWDVMVDGCRPALTSVDMDLEGIGRTAAELLLAAINGEPGARPARPARPADPARLHGGASGVVTRSWRGTGMHHAGYGRGYGPGMTPRPTADPTIGERIQARRLLRGWSIRHAASRAGVSHATWSRIERGRQAADNRFMLADIAAALECSPADLAGTPVPAADRAAMAAQRRRARHPPGARGHRPHRGGHPARAAGRRAGPHRRAGRHAAAGLRLRRRGAADAGSAARSARGGRRAGARAALRLLCKTTFIASSVVRNLGHPAEAWLGAERCRDAAEAAEDPVLRGYAAYARAEAAASCVGSYRRGLTLAGRAVDDLGRTLGSRGGLRCSARCS